MYRDLIHNQVREWLSSEKSDEISMFDINYNDFLNYKEPTFMIYSGITCTFKCDKENGTQVCQNWGIRKNKVITASIRSIIDRYFDQTIAKAISFQGLEPLDNLKQLLWFISEFRIESNDPIIIWTGYTEEECIDLLELIKKMHWKNIIIKFGRFIPDRPDYFDETLGVYLASNNQFAKEVGYDK